MEFRCSTNAIKGGGGFNEQWQQHSDERILNIICHQNVLRLSTNRIANYNVRFVALPLPCFVYSNEQPVLTVA